MALRIITNSGKVTFPLVQHKSYLTALNIDEYGFISRKFLFVTITIPETCYALGVRKSFR